MGLFRRGTKLLRLGSGLRDCCCRPEKPPEECWCPDTCRYYFEWGGSRRFPARTLAEETCPHPLDFFAESIDEPYGLCYSAISRNETTGDKQWFYAGDIVGACRGMIFSTQQRLSGVAFKSDFTDAALDAGLNPYNPNVFYAFNLTAVVYTGMTGLPVFSDQPPDTWAITFSIYTNVLIQVLFGRSEILFLEQRTAVVYVPARCQANALYECSQEGTSRLHLDEDANFIISGSGVTFDGTLHEWAITTTHENQANDWRVAGEYPFDEELTLSIRGKSTCQPGLPCDCNATLIGRRVLFEGREFTVGDLDTILGTSIEHDGQSYWEEVSTGSFRRTDYETCGDGSYVRRVKQATVSCSDFDGVERWYVILDHTCYDRDLDECLPGFTASRERTWTGYFSCIEEGKPLGMPKGENGFGDPELVFDFTNGTLEFSCVGEQGCCGFGGSGIPFISFPNPDF